LALFGFAGRIEADLLAIGAYPLRTWEKSRLSVISTVWKVLPDARRSFCVHPRMLPARQSIGDEDEGP
jgi:hypothetical protein